MLDFNFASFTRVSLVEVNKPPRALVDPRAANAANPPAISTQRKRRPHDGLYSGKPVEDRNRFATTGRWSSSARRLAVDVHANQNGVRLEDVSCF